MTAECERVRSASGNCSSSRRREPVPTAESLASYLPLSGLARHSFCSPVVACGHAPKSYVVESAVFQQGAKPHLRSLWTVALTVV
jgi:hypothetical protein